MDIKRVVLYAALVLVSYSLWTNWQLDYPTVIPVTENSPTKETSNQLLPNMTATESTEPNITSTETKENNASQPTKTIEVKTDVLNLVIDLQHGDIVGAQLLNYPVSVEQKGTPFTLLENISDEKYVANSSLFVVRGNKVENLDFNYTAQEQHYVLANNQDKLTVTLKGRSPEGLAVAKNFIFTKGSYLIDVSYDLLNEGTTPFKGYMNTQLLRSSPAEDKSSLFHVGSYTGASYSSPGQHRYQKVTFKNMSSSNLDTQSQGGWIAMQQHYFLTAWVPNANEKNRFYTRALDGDYTIGAVSQPITLAPTQTGAISAQLYVGPESTHILKTISPGLDLTVDYGWLWFLSSLIFSFMRAIYQVVGNWGWSIVIVTLLIKLAFYRLSATSYKSMAAVRKLEPKLRALRERYGDDKAKISQATMELYKQEKVNPLGGCLPVLVQIPVFIALYWVLLESVELRQAPFIFWIKDLAAADPYHVLPLIMGISMLVQQRLNPAPPDPMQAKIMMFLPILFTVFFWNFPAGLVLYSIVNNSLSILQQWYITRKYSNDKPRSKLVVAK